MEKQDSFPCIICGTKLQACFDYVAQPDDGVMCSTSGNYGSTVYDPFDGRFLAFNICDECLVIAGQQGRLMESRRSRPVWALTPMRIDGVQKKLKTIVGSQELAERDYAPWSRESEIAGHTEDVLAGGIMIDVDEPLPEKVHLNVSLDSLRESFEETD